MKTSNDKSDDILLNTFQGAGQEEHLPGVKIIQITERPRVKGKKGSEAGRLSIRR